MPVNHFDSFITSMYEVFSTMIGIELERIDRFEKDEAENQIIIGAMVLRGENSYLITIETDYNSAGFIISNMTGLLPDELSTDDLVDGVQELVNIVAGATKHKLEQLGNGFVLTSTFAFKGNDVGFFTKNGINKKIAYFKAMDAFITLNLYNM